MGSIAISSADYDRTGNALLNRLFGAQLHDVPWNGDRNGAIHALADRLRADDRKPFVVPYGVSNAMGAVGYASTTLEIAQQSAAAGCSPAAIVHCTGSAGTQAGLIHDGRWTKDQDIVFIHTGGMPALFAYHHLFD